MNQHNDHATIVAAHLALGLRHPDDFLDAAWTRSIEAGHTGRQVGTTTRMLVRAALAAVEAERRGLRRVVVVQGYSDAYTLVLVRQATEYARRLGHSMRAPPVLAGQFRQNYIRSDDQEPLVFYDHYLPYPTRPPSTM